MRRTARPHAATLVALSAALLLGALYLGRAVAQEEGGGAAPMEFETYQLVLLRSGPNRDAVSPEEVQRIQMEHIGHLRKMGASGRMLVAGPFGDQPDPTLRGLCLYRVGSLEEARALAEADPAVAAGRLRVEVLTWYTEKGVLAFPRTAREASAPPQQEQGR